MTLQMVNEVESDRMCMGHNEEILQQR